MELPINYDNASPKVRREVREEYVRLQKGLCFHCKQPLTGPPCDIIRAHKINWKLFPDNFRKYPIHLHHCHTTGLTYGAVHNYCNAYLWQYHGE